MTTLDKCDYPTIMNFIFVAYICGLFVNKMEISLNRFHVNNVHYFFIRIQNKALEKMVTCLPRSSEGHPVKSYSPIFRRVEPFKEKAAERTPTNLYAKHSLSYCHSSNKIFQVCDTSHDLKKQYFKPESVFSFLLVLNDNDCPPGPPTAQVSSSLVCALPKCLHTEVCLFLCF